MSNFSDCQEVCFPHGQLLELGEHAVNIPDAMEEQRAFVIFVTARDTRTTPTWQTETRKLEQVR